ncbi:penicillin acylase family protein [Xanthomarina sp. F1114]|uniref:penicillin acylase family protein n=1 Tax=Xanthomarina sp. F1114 TaxID=2996019 RepID=UPI00225E647A|nr:penicillin acylase family protein [Xanthomarina sp. F1114]MCX7549001.1 penicillin acylase family protein [Xanthomarina sp. F1114]
MKYLKFLVSLLLLIGIFFILNTKLGAVPALGEFLNPAQGIWQNEQTESTTGNVEIPNLSEKVTVHYDENLVPHIFAQNDTDLYRAQGYITAKHRLWQMDFQTFAAAGRLSEIIGEKALDYDRAQRRKGIGFGAENAIKKMEAEDPEIIELLEAYSDGVNSYIQSLNPKDYPVEYKLLGYQPELWALDKTAYLLMYMTDMLCSREHDLEYTNALRLLGEERFDLLYPDFFDVNDPIISKETDWSYIETAITETPLSELPLDSIAETMEKPHANNGSNNWAVSGKKSYSGNPILANDPHLGLNLPSIWFVMQLATPEHNSYGATLPGAMGVVSGFNTDIAWAETNATRDVKDWYKIEFKDKSRTQYKYNGAWKDATLRVEEIKINGKETFIDSVIYTHHGPVSYDHTFKGNGQEVGYAMKWIGHIGGNNQRTLIDLNSSKNYDDYLAALQHWVAPAQNFAFASTSGDIALWIQGLFPNKWQGQGKFLMDGSNPDHDWQSFIPKENNAFSKNPERGFVSSANQHPVDKSYPFYVFNDGYETYRNRVINDFFRSKETFNIQDFKDLQNNNYNLRASELLPYMLEHIDNSSLSNEEQEVLKLITAWDYNSDIDKIAPSIWDLWWKKLYPLTWDEFDDENIAYMKPFMYQTIYLLKNYPEDELMDIVATPEKETAKDLFLITFKETVKELNEWKEIHGNYNWQAYKATYVGHLLQGLPAFSRFDLPIGGDRHTVNAADTNHGPSWRMIVEMTSPPTALGIYPGGQSGNPGSKYYDNFIDRWAVGEYFEALFIQDQNNTEGVISTQTLTP